MQTPAKQGGIPRKSLTSAVADKLREKILRGELQEGQQLRQDAIAAELDVSRIPVREALRQLEAEGLISIVPHRGAVVSALSPEEIEELFDIRAVLESFILRRALPRLTDADFQRAEEILKEYEAALENEADIGSWGELNWRFHSALYGAAKRPVLMALLRTLNNNCDRYTRLQLLVSHSPQAAAAAHRKILDICRTRDPDLAGGEVYHHMTDAGAYLKEFLQKRREQAKSATAN